MTNYDVTWNYPTKIIFGIGKINELSNACQTVGMHRPLFVTDPQLKNLPITQNALETLKKNHVAVSVFSSIKGNPTSTQVEQGVLQFRQMQCDGIIAFGGGSAIDTAKTIALLANQTCSIWDLEDKGNNYLRADSNKIVPTIAVPTTSGTGSEVGRAALITDENTHSKKIIFHPKMLPSLVICDPTLTLGVPKSLTAATGMDALAHNLEAFCSPVFHPMADGIALEGMRLIKKWLPIAVEDGSNLEARTYMMAAASMGAAAFQKGLGAIHSLSHPVGAIYDAHHGLLNAIFMPYVLVFNKKYIEEKMQRLARYLDLPTHNFSGVLQWIEELCKQIGIPKTLAEIKINEDLADKIAAQAMMDGSTPTNPRPLNVSLLTNLFLAAVRGNYLE